MLFRSGLPPHDSVYVWRPDLLSYTRALPDADFGWQLLRALYMEGDFPTTISRDFGLAIEQMAEANGICPAQFKTLVRDPRNREAAAILDQVDSVLGKIGELVPEAGIIVRWLETERIRLGPLPFEQLVQATAEIHARLDAVLAVYRPRESSLPLTLTNY